MIKFFNLILVLALLVTLNGDIVTYAATPYQAVGLSPSTVREAPDPDVAQDSPAQQAIIIDHTCTDLSKIPEYWIEQAKAQLRLCYGHTSHGSQPVSGMQVLMNNTPGGLYDFNTTGAIEPGVLSLDDRTPAGDLGNPDRVTWEARTRTHLGGPGSDRNVVVWSWCGQVSSADEADINTYLTLMNGLEVDYPSVSFVYMTGHLNGTGVSGNLNVRNEQIRDYCRANHKVLFDFADIESYDPDGNYFLDRGADDGCYYDGGNWANEWCAAHPGDPLCDSCSCAHSRPLNCNLKARAFWWMLARIAGWDGPSESAPQKAASIVTPVYGQTVTYTIVAQRFTAHPTATVALTDEVPAGLSYVSGTLSATSGAWDDSAVTTLHWTGVLSSTPAVTVTYAVTVSAPASQIITNTATIAVPGAQPLTCTATVCANCYTLYLPLALRDSD